MGNSELKEQANRLKEEIAEIGPKKMHLFDSFGKQRAIERDKILSAQQIAKLSRAYEQLADIESELGNKSEASSAYENAAAYQTDNAGKTRVYEKYAKSFHKYFPSDGRKIAYAETSARHFRGPSQATNRTNRIPTRINLEKATATASIVGILGGIFFLSSNITGNAIGNLGKSSSNMLGAVLLVIGFVAGFFWMKKK